MGHKEPKIIENWLWGNKCFLVQQLQNCKLISENKQKSNTLLCSTSLNWNNYS